MDALRSPLPAAKGRRSSLTQQTGLLQCGGALRVTRRSSAGEGLLAAAAAAMKKGVQVVVRMRPPLPSEAEAARVKLAVDARAGRLSMTHMRRDYTFQVDGILREEAGQEEVYDTAGIRGIVACVVYKGVNASVFAYGCTGSGKSHTMQGAPSEEGIVPRALRQVLAAAAEAEEEEEDGGGGGGSCRVLISIFEIYQEKLRDLLVFDDAAGAGVDAGGGAWGRRKQSFGSSSGSGRSGFLFGGSNGAQHHHHQQRASFAPNVDRGGGIGARNSADLPVREDAKGNIIVPGLNETEVKTYEEFAALYQRAHAQRQTAGTRLNATSSRSHAVLLVKVVKPGGKVGKLHLIDLAGSERNSKTGNAVAGAAADARLKESANINTSLFVLGKVIDALNAGETRIPFRDSKLTRLLQDSLGGKALALMICCVAPTQALAGETCHALGYASKARAIVKNRAQSLYPDGECGYEDEEAQYGQQMPAPAPSAAYMAPQRPAQAAPVRAAASATVAPVRVAASAPAPAARAAAASVAAAAAAGAGAGFGPQQSGGGGGGERDMRSRLDQWRAGRVATTTTAAGAAARPAASASAAAAAAAPSLVGGAKRLASAFASAPAASSSAAASTRAPFSTSTKAAAPAPAAKPTAAAPQPKATVRTTAPRSATAPTAASSSRSKPTPAAAAAAAAVTAAAAAAAAKPAPVSAPQPAPATAAAPAPAMAPATGRAASNKRKIDAAIDAAQAAADVVKKLRPAVAARRSSIGGGVPMPAPSAPSKPASTPVEKGGGKRMEEEQEQEQEQTAAAPAPVPPQLLSPGSGERAKDMIVAGKKAEKKGDLRGALRFYQGAQSMLPSHQKLGQKVQALQARLQQQQQQAAAATTARRRSTRSSTSSASFEEQVEAAAEEAEEEDNMDWACAGGEGEENGEGSDGAMEAAQEAKAAVAAAVVRYRPSSEGGGTGAVPMEEGEGGGESLQTLHQEAKGVLEAALLETLNAGSKEALLALHGIGKKRAELIMEMRETRPFSCLQDLVTAKVLPPKAVETLAAINRRG